MMTILLLVSFLTFVFYYLASFDSSNSKYKLPLVICFVLSSFVLRLLLRPELNNDYDLYFNFKIFQKPTSFLSIFMGEPYLYMVYAFFKLFTNDKELVFLCMYWFNFLVGTMFYVWLLTRKDVQMWKKMFLFSCYYFFFSFVLLRNGPAYILFAYYFYYVFRGRRFNWILLTPLMHMSSWLLLVTLFHDKKHYFTIFVVLFILTALSYFILFPVLSEMAAFDKIVFKINTYASGMPIVGIIHKLFFVLITILILSGGLVYKKKMLNPILVTTLVFYYVTFFINPVMGFRFSPFVFLALFLFNFEELKNEKIIRFMNLFTVLLFPCFLYALFHTHHL
ncbi:MAG: hypothetical protein H7Y10_05130 [Flavobacterium sp.]|nr:hypothetical protein [Flavobacterium sp.]